MRPDDPITPDDIEEQRMCEPRPFDIAYRYEIARGREMVSWFTAGTTAPGAPGYEHNRQFFSAHADVAPAHRRHGIAASWLPLVVELMQRHGCTTLGVSSEEESGHAFMRWVGADPKMFDAENRLRLAEVDWAMVEQWIADGPRRSPDTRLEIYDDHVPESMREDFAKQLASLLNTIPFDDLDHGEIVETAASLSDWYGRMDRAKEIHYTVLSREPDGEISGMTDVTWAPYRRTIISQKFTGVNPSARGRGIGRWIKATMLDHMRRLHPEALWISTYNAESNGPMHAINGKLGFKRYRAGTEYQITRDRLAARIRELADSTPSKGEGAPSKA